MLKTIQRLIEKSRLPTYEKRAIRKKILARYRMLTYENRALPDFMIIGAQKSGTTSLYKYLTKHPDIKPSYVVKELNYFDDDYVRGADWYRSNFPKRRKGKLYFEGTTHYLYHPLSPQRIKETLPDIKVIALLRNPIDRAYSNYKHQISAKRETLEFEDAIQSEPGRLAGEKEKLLLDPNYISYNYTHFSYVERGKYINQINNWLKHFPRKQMLILSSDDFFNSTDETLKKIFAFLEVKNIKINTKKQHNTGKYVSKMPDATRQELRTLFKTYNNDLEVLLGRKFDWD